MTRRLTNAGPGDPSRRPTDLDLLKDPLDFIREDHMRMRTVCAAMEQLSHSAAPDPAEVTALLDFLDHEIGVLIRDEEDDLRALLLLRCTEEDEIAPTLERLHGEHAALEALGPGLRAVLAGLDGARSATPEEAAQLTDFADRLRRHLIVENAIVLPIARARLLEEDIVQLRDAMIRRRAAGAQG